MIYQVRLRAYTRQLEEFVNEAACLRILLFPFQLDPTWDAPSEFILVGHILDDLNDQKNKNDLIDPLDVAASAWELGLDSAKSFLEQGPFMIHEHLKNMPQTNLLALPRF